MQSIAGWRGLAVLALLALALSVAPAGAIAEEAAVLNARAYSALPEGASIWVEAQDDNDFNLSVQELFTRALEASGLSGDSKTARLQLTFDTRDRRALRNPDALGEIKINHFRTFSLRLNMWSSSHDSLLNRRQGGLSKGRFLIGAISNDGEAKRRLWEAEVSAPARTRNDKDRLAGLVFRIADLLGQTARISAVRPAPSASAVLRLEISSPRA